MADNGIAALVVAGGGGTVLGSIIVAVIQTFGKRGRDLAEASDAATQAQARTIQRLEMENIRMREALIGICEILDVVIDDVVMPAAQKAKLRKATKAAKMAAI